jgi:hypothetical protein
MVQTPIEVVMPHSSMPYEFSPLTQQVRFCNRLAMAKQYSSSHRVEFRSLCCRDNRRLMPCAAGRRTISPPLWCTVTRSPTPSRTLRCSCPVLTPHATAPPHSARDLYCMARRAPIANAIGRFSNPSLPILGRLAPPRSNPHPRRRRPPPPLACCRRRASHSCTSPPTPPCTCRRPPPSLLSSKKRLAAPPSCESREPPPTATTTHPHIHRPPLPKTSLSPPSSLRLCRPAMHTRD